MSGPTGQQEEDEGLDPQLHALEGTRRCGRIGGDRVLELRKVRRQRADPLDEMSSVLRAPPMHQRIAAPDIEIDHIGELGDATGLARVPRLRDMAHPIDHTHLVASGRRTIVKHMPILGDVPVLQCKNVQMPSGHRCNDLHESVGQDVVVTMDEPDQVAPRQRQACIPCGPSPRSD